MYYVATYTRQIPYHVEIRFQKHHEMGGTLFCGKSKLHE